MSAYALPIARPTRVLADAVAPQWRAAARAAVLTVAGAALVGLLAQVSVHVPGTPVPVTGQTLGVLLAGAALGWRLGLASMTVYAAAGVLGVPWFTHGTSGYTSATFGYVVDFIVAATVLGRLAERQGDRTVPRALASMLVASLVIYAFGVPWLAASLHTSLWHAWRVGAVPFLVGDGIKALAAAGLLPLAWAGLRRTGPRLHSTGVSAKPGSWHSVPSSDNDHRL